MRKLLFLFVVFIPSLLFPCTTAIISGSVTQDGRPLMWKNIDSEKTLNKKVAFLNEGKYSAVAIVNVETHPVQAVWVGCNSAGFAIMSSDTGNLPDSISLKRNLSGVFMKEALLNCGSVEEFDTLLRNRKKPNGFRVNFGVIDAKGNAFYYEVNNFSFFRYDVNDPKIAPNGYLIRTNFSFSGTKGKGHGYIRYDKASALFKEAAMSNDLDESFLLNKVCFSLDDKSNNQNGYSLLSQSDDNYVYIQESINRYSTSGAAVIKGVKKQESPKLTMMWTMLGSPLTTVPVPVWITSGGNLPGWITSKGTEKSLLCNLSLMLKNAALYPKGSEGKYFINSTKLMNKEGEGIMQKIEPIRGKVFEKGMHLYKSLLSKQATEENIEEFYRWTDSYFTRELNKIKVN